MQIIVTAAVSVFRLGRDRSIYPERRDQSAERGDPHTPCGLGRPTARPRRVSRGIAIYLGSRQPTVPRLWRSSAPEWLPSPFSQPAHGEV